MTLETIPEPMLLGWREWVALPELGLTLVKAKVDTGARTSTLHAFYVDSFYRCGKRYVRFGVHPLQRRTDVVVHGEALVVDQRRVADSGGHREERFVIHTRLLLAGCAWPIEVTLTNRETMLFRMLLGRTAIAGRARVDPARSFLTGRVERPWERYG
ncbi:MAG: ATP-dependent zinc protease [Thiocapsa sp.]|nr:ATP-dependent zinc protease [Thiocapsa sp.]MCG6895668.1 ATP-dependent zinc protease [Thiocapsa sp.]